MRGESKKIKTFPFTQESSCCLARKQLRSKSVEVCTEKNS